MSRVSLAAMVLALFCVACPQTNDPRQVVEKRFPACFEEDRIGAGQGVRCNYNEEEKEWRIVFWHGWGDCPSGCIHKEDYAFYVVDENGDIYKCNEDFEKLDKVPAGKKITPSPPPKP